MATMTIRCDAKLKEEASEVAKYYGFDLSSVTRALWMQMVRNYSIPLSFENDEPNEESLESIREARELFATGSSRFNNSDELLAALKA